MLRFLFMTVLTLLLNGCSSWFGQNSYINRHEAQYLKSNSVAPLQLPVEMNHADITQDYPVPTIINTSPVKPIKLTPPDSLADNIETGKISAAVLKQPVPATTSTNKTTSTNSQVINTKTNIIAKSAITVMSNNAILLNQPISQAWISVGNSLRQLDYKIIMDNPTRNIYYIVDTAQTEGKLNLKTPIIQVHLKSAEHYTQITLTDNDGKQVIDEVAHRILTDINNALNNKSSSKLPLVKWLQKIF